MTRSDDAATRGSSHGIVEEHATIRTLMDRVGAAKSAADLCSILQEFRAVAVPHFAGEEASDGFFETVLESSPRHARTVEQLSAEHATFLAEMERLAGLCDGADARFDELLAGASELVDRLRVHEATENQLLFEVVNTDLGAGD